MRTDKILLALFVVLLVYVSFLNQKISDLENRRVSGSVVENYEIAGISSDLSDTVAKIRTSIVSIEAANAVSSGFIVESDGSKIYIMTTAHSIVDGDQITAVLANALRYPAVVVGVDPVSDLALLSIESSLAVTGVEFGNSAILKDGEFVVITGTPSSPELSFSSEMTMVSSALRTIASSIQYKDRTIIGFQEMIQLSGLLAPGYSGAGVFNMKGQLVGIVTYRNDAATFALTSLEAKESLAMLKSGKQDGKNNFGIKGLYIETLKNHQKNGLSIPLDQTYGLYVTDVLFGSDAYELGVRSGDILLAINDVKINSFEDLLRLYYHASEPFEMTVLKDGAARTLKGEEQ